MNHPDAFPDADTFHRARQALVQAVIEITMPARSDSTLASRNVVYHADELLVWIDAWGDENLIRSLQKKP
jgi:hypothetical protein